MAGSIPAGYDSRAFRCTSPPSAFSWQPPRPVHQQPTSRIKARLVERTPHVDLSTGALTGACVQEGSTDLPVAALLHPLGLADHLTRRRTPVIGYGSNATV